MTENAPIVFVVDDEPGVCVAIKRLIRSVGLNVQTFSSAQDFLRSQRPDGPGCLVLDVRLPDLSGLDLQPELAKANIDLPIIFITGHGDIPMSVRAMKAGAVEFLTKPFREQDLLEAIQLGIRQHRTMREQRAEILELQRRYELLTLREREVVQLVGEGKTSKEVATMLGMTLKTAETHRSNIMIKLNLHSTVELVLYAVRNEIIHVALPAIVLRRPQNGNGRAEIAL